MVNPKFWQSLATLNSEERSSFKSYLEAHLRHKSDPHKCYLVLHKQKNNLYFAGFDGVIRKKHFKSLTPKTYSNLLSKLQGHFESWLA